MAARSGWLTLALGLVFMLSMEARALPVPFVSIEGSEEEGQKLTSSWLAGDAVFAYPQNALPIKYKFLSSTTVKDADGNPQAFPQWAKAIIQNNVLVDWGAANNAIKKGTQIMLPDLAAGDTGRYFDVMGERQSFGQLYPVGVNFLNANPNDFAHVTFAFEDFSNAIIDNLLRDKDWPGKPGGQWQPWSQRSTGLEFDQNGLIIGAKDDKGNPIPMAIDGLLGVWIPSQYLEDEKIFFNLPNSTVTDMILFNSRVNWNVTANAPAKKELDFYHVALHEVGHDLGLDHAVAVPAPPTSALLLIGMALVAVRRRSRANAS